MGFIKKVKAVEQTGVMSFDFDKSDLQNYPALSEHLGMNQYDDGTKRRTSSFSVFVEGGQLKICFSDKDNGRVAFLSIDKLGDILDGLEACLQEDDMDWRRAWKSDGKKQK